MNIILLDDLSEAITNLQYALSDTWAAKARGEHVDSRVDALTYVAWTTITYLKLRCTELKEEQS